MELGIYALMRLILITYGDTIMTSQQLSAIINNIPRKLSLTYTPHIAICARLCYTLSIAAQ